MSINDDIAVIAACSKNRDVHWDFMLEMRFSCDPPSHWKHIKKYFFSGDIERFIQENKAFKKKQGLVDDKTHPVFSDVIKYSPAKTMEELLAAIKKTHSCVFSEYDLDFKSLEYIRNDFLKTIENFVFYPEMGFDKNLSAEAFFYFFGETFDPERKINYLMDNESEDLCFDSYENILWLMTRSFGCYLYNSPDFYLKYSSIVDERFLNYYLSLFKFVGKDFFIVNNRGGVEPRQLVMRRLLLGLLEVNLKKKSKSEVFFCRNYELHEKLREGLLDMVDKPLYFEKLLDFLERHGEEGFYKN